MNSKHHKPYWKRAHQDWRMWVGVILMLAAMIVYVVSDDFSLLPEDDAPPATELPVD